MVDGTGVVCVFDCVDVVCILSGVVVRGDFVVVVIVVPWVVEYKVVAAVDVCAEEIMIVCITVSILCKHQQLRQPSLNYPNNNSILIYCQIYWWVWLA